MTVMLVMLLERSCVDVVENKVAIVLGQHWCKLKAEEKKSKLRKCHGVWRIRIATEPGEGSR